MKDLSTLPDHSVKKQAMKVQRFKKIINKCRSCNRKLLETTKRNQSKLDKIVAKIKRSV